MGNNTIGRERVLIVDDDPVSLEVCRERLEQMGYAVEVRATAIGTSAAVIQDLPDLILLDVNMPALNGPQLAVLVRKAAQGRPVAIILHSSRGQRELSNLARLCGAIGVIQKTSDEISFIKQFEALALLARKQRGEPRRESM